MWHEVSTCTASHYKKLEATNEKKNKNKTQSDAFSQNRYLSPRVALRQDVTEKLHAFPWYRKFLSYQSGKAYKYIQEVLVLLLSHPQVDWVTCRTWAKQEADNSLTWPKNRCFYHLLPSLPLAAPDCWAEAIVPTTGLSWSFCQP